MLKKSEGENEKSIRPFPLYGRDILAKIFSQVRRDSRILGRDVCAKHCVASPLLSQVHEKNRELEVRKLVLLFSKRKFDPRFVE